MKVSFMITSRNRRDELLKTLLSCREQTYRDREIHVVDDGSDDDTYDEVRRHFPEVVVTRNEDPIGSVASRNLLFQRVSGDILIGFDDDSRFMSSDSTLRIVDRFCAEPDLGLLDFQDIGPEHPERIPDASPGRLRGERHVSSFGAGRYAIRREVLTLTGLFPSFFWHAFEEPDLALRVWDHGFRCLAWYDILVWHEFSGANRDERRTHYFHARNEILSTLMRAPLPVVIPLVFWRVLSQLRYSVKRRWWSSEPRIWRDALRLVPRAMKERRPVSLNTMRRCLVLNRRWISDPEAVWTS